MAGSVMSESKTNNLVACSRWGFGLHSNRPLDGLTTEETIEFNAIEALPPFDENGNNARSTVMLSSSIRPSSRNRVRAGQRASA
jgi:hypothetical protein